METARTRLTLLSADLPNVGPSAAPGGAARVLAGLHGYRDGCGPCGRRCRGHFDPDHRRRQSRRLCSTRHAVIVSSAASWPRPWCAFRSRCIAARPALGLQFRLHDAQLHPRELIGEIDPGRRARAQERPDGARERPGRRFLPGAGPPLRRRRLRQGLHQGHDGARPRHLPACISRRGRRSIAPSATARRPGAWSARSSAWSDVRQHVGPLEARARSWRSRFSPRSTARVVGEPRSACRSPTSCMSSSTRRTSRAR